MRSFVINLARRPDRLQRCTARFREVGVALDPFVAIDAALLPPLDRDPLVPTGLRANWLSHEALLRQLADSDDEYAMIVEDDAVPTSRADWPLLVDRAPDALASAGLHYLQLGFVSWQYGLTRPGVLERLRIALHPELNDAVELDTRRKVARASALSGTHAYIASRTFARKVMGINDPCWTGSDGLYMRISSMSGADGLFPCMARLRTSIVEQESRTERRSALDSDVTID